MDPFIAETLQMLIGFGAGVTVLVSILRYKLKRSEIERGATPHLEELVNTLRMEINDLRAEQSEQLADLYERLEFAERLLTRGRQDKTT